MRETSVQKSFRSSFDRIYWLAEYRRLRDRTTPLDDRFELQIRLEEFFTTQIHGTLGVNLAIMRLGGAEEFYVPARNFFAGLPLARGGT